MGRFNVMPKKRSVGWMPVVVSASVGFLWVSSVFSQTTSSDSHRHRPDRTRPIVSATVPANAATDVALNTKIAVTFSEPMDPATMTSASFRLEGGEADDDRHHRHKDEEGAERLTVGYTGVTATLTPARPLAPHTVYTATVRRQARDLAGHALAHEYVWSFTTGATPATTTPLVSFTVPPLVIPPVPVPMNGVSGAVLAALDPVAVPVSLGTAASFAVLAASTVTNTGATSVTGDLGLSPGTAVTGFPPGTVIGTLHAADAAAAQAQADLTIAYNDTAGRTGGTLLAGNLGGRTLTPGLYTSTSSLEISSGDLVLDARGDINAVFLFQMGSTFTMTSGRQIILSGGAQAANVFWQVGSSATLGTGSVFKGTILALASITVTTGAAVEGRLLARTAAVTLDTNTVALPIALVNPAVVGNAGTGWPISGNVAAAFSEPMDPLTINTQTFRLRQGATVVPGAVSYAGVTAVFNPTALLVPLTIYTATVTTGAKSLTGAALPADFSWTFTTGVTVDTTQPLISATVPANGASAVPINATVTCAFTKAMNPLTLTPLSFTVTHGGAAVAGVVSYAGFTATFTPTALLASSTVYTATVTAAAQDLAGNPLAFNTSWSFKTGVNLDTTSPVVTVTVPTNGATNVAINQSINATFSKAMDPLTLTTATLKVTGPGGAILPGIVSYALLSQIATLIPALPLASNTLYTATVTSGAKDVAGNALVGFSWTFTTGVTPVGQPPVALGAATTFAVLAASTVTSTGATRLNGNLGLSPGTSVTGFPPGVINGTLHAADAAAALAQLALTIAYTDAAGRTIGSHLVAGNLGGQTLAPGLYTSSSSLAISAGDLTLDAEGDVNAVFIFQMGSTLTTTAGRRVILVNGAKAANVFWLVGSSATLGTGSVFKGNILALASITVTTGAAVEGRLLARTAAVTLDTNTVTLPTP
jgi:hypothetical protein